MCQLICNLILVSSLGFWFLFCPVFFFLKPILFECHLNRVDGGTFTYFDGFLIILSCSN